MVSIKQLQLTNFKSYRHLNFEMKPLNILIGPNGSGKSNLISFFKMMAGAADRQLASYIFGSGGIDQLSWRGAFEREFIAWSIEFNPITSSIGLLNWKNPVYQVELRQLSPGNFTVLTEELSNGTNPTVDRKDILFYSRGGEIEVIQNGTVLSSGIDPKELSRRLQLSDTELALSQITDPVNSVLMNELHRAIEHWTIFRGFGENALHNIHSAQPIEIVNPMRLKPDGSNLASVLQSLANESRYADANENLNNIIRLAFPDFDRFALVTAGTGRVELQWRTKNRWQFPAQFLSDGMLRFLGLAVLLNLPDLPPLIAIDEPEIGLHPHLMSLLAGMLKSASQRTQIVVTTHSPELLNAPDIELNDIVLVDQNEGETTLKRVEKDDYLAMWMEKYQSNFGRLWVMDKLR